SYRYARSLETQERIVVGLNHFRKAEKAPDFDLFQLEEEVEHGQADAVREVRRKRDQRRVDESLRRVEAACRDLGDNLMPYLIDCVNAYATEGEIVESLVNVYGRYTERAVF
ncbi:MAG: methylmalonyl-CoA mutase, partial [Candidatus Eremiobacteraeota bacterium]|nr:methylmalonyl-CoA mutase [Candidatus Eremiobacteraeota bacterium]